jgi:hypothetical protein
MTEEEISLLKVIRDNFRSKGIVIKQSGIYYLIYRVISSRAVYEGKTKVLRELNRRCETLCIRT